MRPSILLVTCCLEQSRYDVLKRVIANIKDSCPPEWANEITVFDNASTFVGMGELCSAFKNVYRADRNVGYWTAIDWWLDSLAQNPPEYTYIIESDMIHYGAHRMQDCVTFMDEHPDVGAVRLQEYSVENFRLYNKERPVQGSHKNIWQVHTNRVTNEGVKHERVGEGSFWRTNFLTQLPALNRYVAMRDAFNKLRVMHSFTEFDFQQLYHSSYPRNALINGGIFTCEQQPHDKNVITGSWTLPKVLAKQGYLPTRQAFIAPRDQYTVVRLK